MGLVFENVRVMRRRGWLFGVFIAWGVFSIVPWMTLRSTHLNLALVLFAGCVGVQLLLGSMWNRRRRIDVGMLEFDGALLRINGRALCTRASIVSVHVAEHDGVWRLRLQRGSDALRTIDVETVHKRDARLLEEALGCGRTRSLTPFTVWLGYHSMLRWIIAATVITVVCAFAIGFAVFFAWLLALNAILIRHTWCVRVGADGMELRRFGSRQYVPFADIADVRLEGRHLFIDRRIAPSVRLSHLQYGPTLRRLMGHDVFHFHALREAIEDGRTALAKRSRPAVGALARGDRSVAEWVGDLRGMSARNATSYRESALPFELLFDVALDESEAAAVRVGAVLAVAPELDDDARARMRLAAVRAASMEVRFALAAAAYGDDDGLMKAAGMLR